VLFGRSRPGRRVDQECWLGAAADAADVDGEVAEEAADPLFLSSIKVLRENSISENETVIENTNRTLVVVIIHPMKTMP